MITLAQRCQAKRATSAAVEAATQALYLRPRLIGSMLYRPVNNIEYNTLPLTIFFLVFTFVHHFCRKHEFYLFFPNASSGGKEMNDGDISN